MAPRDTDSVVRTFSRTISRSLPNASPLAEAAIARDLEEASDDEEATASDGDGSESDSSTVRLATSVPNNNYSFTGSYRRGSFTAAGSRGTLISRGVGVSERDRLTTEERNRILEEERSLLRDNNLIPPKHPAGGRRRSSIFDGLRKTKSSDQNGSRSSLATQSEVTPLLGDPSLPYGGQDDPKSIAAKWDEAVAAGAIQTTWRRETKVLVRYSLPLMLTFVLQYSLPVASVFTIGHLGVTELAAVSLASMTANITGYAVYQGLATSLDTLCAQAYGSGRKKLVGLQMQRMIYFLWTITIPIAAIWLASPQILRALVPDEEVADLAGLYLRIVVLGAPGYATFEAAKRYVQAQGLFSASLYVLLVFAPLNAFLNWLFVWHFDWGYVGAPIAVAITDNLLPVGLFIYVRFFSGSGMSCWNGFTRKAFQNWGPMVRLALPGVIMVEAECLAFEILTFAASYFGTKTLAAQSVLATVTSLTFQIPFPLSIAGSTRVANLIGATLVDAAKTQTKVTFSAAVLVGIFNVALLSGLKGHIPKLFTDDAEVIATVSQILPLCASFQFFDALAAACNGILRGLGRQEIGGYVQIFCYYVIAMPISFGTGFGLDWKLWGLWSGVALALALVFVIEFVYLMTSDWNRSVEEARARNLES